MWRMALALLLRGVAGCLEPFYGPACFPCPIDSRCNGTARQACTGGLRAWSGSRDCYNVSSVEIVGALEVAAWTANDGLNPSNDTCGCYRNTVEAAVTMDAGSSVWLGGIRTASYEGAWVRSYYISYSEDAMTWRPLGGVYAGNSDDVSVKDNTFPYPVRARYVRLHVVDYFLWPSLRAAFLLANATYLDSGTTVALTTSVVQSTSTEIDRSTSTGAATTSTVLNISSSIDHTTTVTSHALSTVSTTHHTVSSSSTPGDGNTSSMGQTTTTLDNTSHVFTTDTSHQNTSQSTFDGTLVTGTTTAPANYSTASPTTSQAPTVICRRLPNMVANASCHYSCAAGAYRHGQACVARPRHSAPNIRAGRVSVRWVHAPAWSRLHSFAGEWALETRERLGPEVAVQVDDRPWMAWSKRHWTPHLDTAWGSEVSPHSDWLLLPWPVTAGVRVRALVNHTLRTFASGRRCIHGACGRAEWRGSVQLAWGMGSAGARGDSQSVCSVSCPRGVVQHVNASVGSYHIFNLTSGCANVPDAVEWLRGNTQLLGVDGAIEAFVQTECRRGAQAWLVPQMPRQVLWEHKVQAVCYIT